MTVNDLIGRVPQELCKFECMMALVTPQNVILTQNVISIAAKCNNINAKCNKIINAKCNNFPTQNVITFLTQNETTQIVITPELQLRST